MTSIAHEPEAPAEPMTKRQLIEALTEQGGLDGQVQLFLQDGDTFVYYTLAKVTCLNGVLPLPAILEAGEFISGGG